MHQKRTPKQNMWEAHIKAREEQKISFVEYASKHHLNLKSFYAASSVYHKRQQPKPSAFKEVRLKKVEVEEKSGAALFSCTLNHVALQFNNAPNPKWFAQLIKHIGEQNAS